MSIRVDDAGIWVELTDLEWRLGAEIGFQRQCESVRRGRKDQHGFKDRGDGLGNHINGACGEIAKWRGIYFDPTINNFQAADIGKRVQVRTRSMHEYDLLVPENAKDGDVYVHVTGIAPLLCIRGWMLAGAPKQDKWLKPYGGRESAWFIPSSELRRFPLNPQKAAAA